MNKTIERAKREHCALNQGFPDSEYIKELNNIETELKESEKALTFYKYCVKNKIDLTKLDQISNDYVAMPIEVWEEKLKKLAVLEIIVNKKVNVGLLSRCATVERYNKGVCYEPRQLTQEEYDLLKEVLL